jgi:Family of unknown function (DUF6082)
LRRKDRRVANVAAAFFGVMAILVLVILSPLVLREISIFPNLNWAELSNVGQTYGAVSALLSALALVGVAVSVLFQRREIRFSRVEASRTRHHELMMLGMENPSYFNIFGAPQDVSTDVQRSFVYINMHLQFWQMLWEFSDMSEAELRFHAQGMFSSSLGREYWRRYGGERLRNDNTKEEREFDKTLDFLYKQAVASGPPHDPAFSIEPVAPIEQKAGQNILIALAVTLACGIALGRFVRVARHYRS